MTKYTIIVVFRIFLSNTVSKIHGSVCLKRKLSLSKTVYCVCMESSSVLVGRYGLCVTTAGHHDVRQTMFTILCVIQ